MKKLRKYGLIGLSVGVVALIGGAVTGGLGICGATNPVSPVVMVTGFWVGACAVVALIVSVPTLIVRNLLPQEGTDEGTL